MVQGTGSSVGKSVLSAALCRIFRQDGWAVAPFKAQNMSLQSFVTPDGAEIGRSQAVQAAAACVEPTADMNPILLKPEADYRSQVVIRGKPQGRTLSKEFDRPRPRLWNVVTESLDRLRSQYDVIVIEGAGSPAEINLRAGDIVNMEVALYANAPVLLVGDIDNGGVFASLYGTIALIDQRERDLICGTVVNKFRGDVSILMPGLKRLEELMGMPVLGVVPYFHDIHIPEEDSPAGKNTEKTDSVIDVVVTALPHISNFDDFDPLEREPGVGLRYVRSVAEMGHPDLLIIPGTKTTAADLAWLRNSGIAGVVQGLAGAGTAVVGICGGFQMLGRRILDPDLVESDEPAVNGLGLLPVETRFAARKQTHQVEGSVVGGRGILAGADGLQVHGYEIHMGSTTSAKCTCRLSLIRRSDGSHTLDGCLSGDGWIFGCYVHGLFHNDELRRVVVRNVAGRKGVSLPRIGGSFSQDAEFDKLAHLVRTSLDMDAVYESMGMRARHSMQIPRW